MSDQIKSLVERHIPSGYRGTPEVQRAVDGIVRDLDVMRANIATQVRRAATAKRVPEREVTDLLISCGLVDRPAPAVAAPAASQGSQEGSLTAAVSRLEATIGGLAAFARQHGYRG